MIISHHGAALLSALPRLFVRVGDPRDIQRAFSGGQKDSGAWQIQEVSAVFVKLAIKIHKEGFCWNTGGPGSIKVHTIQRISLRQVGR